MAEPATQNLCSRNEALEKKITGSLSPTFTLDDDHPGRELMNQLVDNASKCIRAANQTERTLRQSKSRGGKVSIGLYEDVVYVTTVQIEVMDEVLSLKRKKKKKKKKKKKTDLHRSLERLRTIR